MENEKVYLDMCRHVLQNGISRQDRTGVGTLSVFGETMKFDISKNIPLFTTKRMPIKTIVNELLWFLRGDTNSKNLEKIGCKIWAGNSSRKELDKRNMQHLNEGDCGENYSFNWRHYGADYTNCDADYTNQGTDQLKYIENLLQNDKFSRRIILNSWNPSKLDKTVLPPCHVMCQFYVDDQNRLSCTMYQRSVDLFLGSPFNITSYSLLVHILAKRNGFDPGMLIINMGDVHVYKNHIQQVKLQLTREIFNPPTITLSNNVLFDWENITVDDFKVENYKYNPSIYAEMAV
jgi:thymidylate synthase